jgi:hypothetical protein
MPFYKNNEFDYGKVLKFLGPGYEHYALVVFMLFVIIIITFGIKRRKPIPMVLTDWQRVHPPSSV